MRNPANKMCSRSQLIGRTSYTTLASDRSGFSLIELVIVIAIIGIVLAIATLSFNSWSTKYNIERVTTELQSDLSMLQLKSMTKKMVHQAVINSNNYIFKQYSSEADNGNSSTSTILSRTTPYLLQNGAFNTAASNLTIVYDERGYVSGSTATIVIGANNTEASYNCLVVSRSRINVGKMNAGTCEFK